MITFPDYLKDFLLSYVKRAFYTGTRRESFAERPFGDADLRFFAKGVAGLSDLFTALRSQIEPNYLNQPEARAGYLLYFLPINFGKTRHVLEQIPADFWRRDRFRVLDLGAGPGSAALAFLETVAEKNPDAEIDLSLVDQNDRALEDARKLLGAAAEARQLKLRSVDKVRSDLRRFRFQGPYDLILVSHAFNEWSQADSGEKAEWLAAGLRGHLAPTGVLAILEPALKRPTRDLMALRDRLAQGGEWIVLSPCLHDRPCPMLEATNNDWCHFYVEWQEPAYLKELDHLVKNDNRFLKVAYVLFGPEEYWSQKITRPPDVYRVVSNRMATRGKTEIVLCGPVGRVQMTRLDKERSPDNEDIDIVRRGDLVKWPGAKTSQFENARQARVGKKDGFRRL